MIQATTVLTRAAADEPIYGSQMMTQQEMNEYRERMRKMANGQILCSDTLGVRWEICLISCGASLEVLIN